MNKFENAINNEKEYLQNIYSNLQAYYKNVDDVKPNIDAEILKLNIYNWEELTEDNYDAELFEPLEKYYERKMKKKEIFDRLKPLIEECFEDELIKSENFDLYNWESKKYYYELKIRDYEFSKDFLISIPEKNVFDTNHIFVFHFTDGIYYCRYNKKWFNFYGKGMYWTNKRYSRMVYPSIYIPRFLLTKLNKEDVHIDEKYRKLFY